MPVTDGKQPLSIAFYTRGTEFNGDTIKYSCLGGSESALLYMARELGALGHAVNVFCNCDKPGQYSGVGYHRLEDFEAFTRAQKQDVCIFSRVLETVAPANARTRVLWLHDIASIRYYQDNLRSLDHLIDRYFLIGAWQQRGFMDAFDFDRQKLTLTRNGVDLELFHDPPPRRRNKLVYINTPFRGLDVLLQLFPFIRQAVPEAELHLYTGMSLYGSDYSAADRQLENLYSQARQLPGVFLSEPRPKAELARELMSARLALYPSHFNECCSIASLESQAAGTPMVTSALAGLNDTIVHNRTGILVEIDNPELKSHSQKYQVNFLNQIVRLMRDDLAWQQLSEQAMQAIAERYTWKMIAAEWETELYSLSAGGTIRSQQNGLDRI